MKKLLTIIAACVAICSTAFGDEKVIGGKVWYYTPNGDGTAAIIGGAMESGETLHGVVTIPSSVNGLAVTEIAAVDSEPFATADSITSLTIPEGVTTIGKGAFNSCTSLETVNLPASLTTIGLRAFSFCDSLTSFELAEGNTAFELKEGCLFLNGTTTLALYPSGRDTFEFSDVNVTAIGDGACYGCYSIAGVTIPDTVTEIGAQAFFSCPSLVEIVVPSSVTTIGDQAFASCGAFSDSGTAEKIHLPVELRPDSDEDVEAFIKRIFWYQSGMMERGPDPSIVSWDGEEQGSVIATWIGGSDEHDWGTASNWSTQKVPDSETDVVIPADAPEGGWVLYIGGNANAKSLTILANTTIQRDAGVSNNGNVVVEESVTIGSTVALTLNSAFIFAGEGKEVSVEGNIVCVNGNSYKSSGFSTLSGKTGSFRVDSLISGTGAFEFRSAATLKKDFILSDDGITTLGLEAAPTFSGEAKLVLSGSGTLVCAGFEPTAAMQAQLQDSENWTGVCELKNVSKDGWNFGLYGNTESTVRLNNVQGYMAFTNKPQNDATVKILNIASGGLTLSSSYHSQVVVFDAVKITGPGAIKIGTKSQISDASNVTKYVFTGDMSEFTGTLDFGTLTGYRPTIVIANLTSELPVPSDYGQIIVAEGATANVNNTWTASGGFVVLGDVVMGANGAIAGDNGVAGSGRIIYSALPSAAPTFRSETYTSGLGTVPVWSGTVELPARNGSGSIALAGFGVSGSKIVLNGITGTDSNSIYLADDTAITATVELKGNLKLTNGSSDKNYSFAEVTGSGNMFLSATGSAGSPYYTYTFTKLTDYTGEINAVKTSDSKYAALDIKAVDVKAYALGDKIVKLAENCNLVTDPSGIDFTIAGAKDGSTLFKATDGNLYAVAFSVTVDDVITYYETFEKAAAAALAADTTITRLNSRTPADSATAGWSYDKKTYTYTKIKVAKVIDRATDESVEYATLTEAVEAAEENGDLVQIVADCSEDVTLPWGVTLTIDDGVNYSGTVSGEGEIKLTQDTDIALDNENWKGTVIIDWEIRGGLKFEQYGRKGSTVRIDQPMTGYLTKGATNGNPVSDAELRIFADVTINDGYPSFEQWPEIGRIAGMGNLTFDGSTKTSGSWVGTDFIIETAELGVFAPGTITIKDKFSLKVCKAILGSLSAPDLGYKFAGIVLDGGKLRNVSGSDMTVKGVAMETDVEGVTLIYKADGEQGPGLYFDPVAYVTTIVSGNDDIVVYYNSLEEAIEAAGTKTITLVKSTDEELMLPVGRTSIEKGEFTCQNIKYPEGAYYTKTSEKDGVTTYLCQTANASVTVDDVTTYYASVQEAYMAVVSSAKPGTVLAVLDGVDYGNILEGWNYDSEAKTYTLVETMVAKVVYGALSEVSYPKLATAVAATDATEIVLLADCDEDVILGAYQTLKPGEYAYSGELGGAGTIYYDEKPTTVPTFAEDWTGTFVVDWNGDDANTALPLQSYGNVGDGNSTSGRGANCGKIEIRGEVGGYLPTNSYNGNIDVIPTVNVTGSLTVYGDEVNPIANFRRITGDGTITFYHKYSGLHLDNFTGTLTTDANCWIYYVNLVSQPTAGEKLVKLGANSSQHITFYEMTYDGVEVAYEASTIELEVKDDGIYVKGPSTVTLEIPVIEHATPMVVLEDPTTCNQSPVSIVDGKITVDIGAHIYVYYQPDPYNEYTVNGWVEIASVAINTVIDASNVTVTPMGGGEEPPTPEPEAPTVEIDENKMEEPVVDEETGVRTIQSKTEDPLTEADFASVTISSPLDGTTAITDAYTMEIVDGKIVVTLDTPEVEDVAEADKAEDDPTGLLADTDTITDATKIAAMPTPDTSNPEAQEEVAALPVKMYPGLWYQASWGDSLDSLTTGDKFQATGSQTHIGVIKQKGDRGFYKLSVSEK